MDGHARFMRWLAEAGAELDGLAIAERDGGRGVVATRGFTAGEVVARVPRPLLISRELVNASSVGRQIRAAGVALSGTHALFAAWLCVERRRAGGPHQPYVAILPTDFSGAALYATAAERGLVAGTLTGAMLDDLAADVAHDHGALTAHVRLCRGLDLAAYTWARLCVASRLFALTIDGIATTALVPLGDLLNHDRDPDTRWGYDQDSEAFALTATRAIAAGAEVTDSYGSKSTSRLVVQYGFALPDNPDDEAELCGHRVTRDLASPAARALWADLRGRHDDDAAALAALTAAIDLALARMATAEPPADARSARAQALLAARASEQAVLAAWRGFAPPAPP